MARSTDPVMEGGKRKAESRNSHCFLLSAFCLLILSLPAAAQSTFAIDGYLNARTARVTGQPSWLQGGLGRFDVGAAGPGERAWRNTAFAQLGADWAPASWFDAHVQVLGRKEPSGTGGRRGGLVEAYAELHGERFQVRAGQFFLGTSRENVDPLWTSPYTLTYSALNTWIGEEVRPIGVDVLLKPNFYVNGGVTIFRGNDRMGTLLAERGWSLGSRLSVYDEKLPLPGGASTIPFERDLDSRNGYAGRLRAQLPERAMIQWTRLDNRASPGPKREQFPWHTRFDVIGAQAGTAAASTILGEYLRGWTSITGSHFFRRYDFETAYAMASRHVAATRWSLRYEWFRSGERGEPNDHETGHAWTVAWLRDVTPHVRFGAEYVRVTGANPIAEQIGASPNAGGSTVTVELRYSIR